jgi:hypothetical protein
MTLPEKDACPNPNGMTVEFGEDVVQAHAWRLKGAGAYGSDVDVISIELYRELAANQKNTMTTLTKWAESAHKHEKRADALARAGDALVEIARTARAFGGVNDQERLGAAVRAWDEVMADRYDETIKETT